MSDPTSQGTEPRGIDGSRVSAWFAEHVRGAVLPLHFTLIAGGRSNLTFRVDDAAGNRFVLRRPPTGHLLPTAHDMAREHRIISALGPAGVPAPPALGLCEDVAVNGAPFYVMGFVDGVIARDERDVDKYLDEPARGRASLALVDTLASIHLVDPDAVGLGDLGRKDAYVARQLKRWHANYHGANQARGGAPLPAIDAIHSLLWAAIPEQGAAAVVHGDYRLDNCILAPDGSRVDAVLDWELCTLGDPLADLAQLLVYWPEPGERSALGHAPTSRPGFARRVELVERYEKRIGRAAAHLDFYVAFAYWRLACILEGVYARYAGGAMADDGTDISGYLDSIGWLAERSWQAARRLGR
ncbi:MAG: phosphotransferase family protein [Acidimicrobiales bacterium]|nr:phosphotransferase family protein [Acidimicrobiales bacterium]